MKKVFCFGNEYIENDKAAIELADNLKHLNLNGFEFIKCGSPEELEGQRPIIIDVVQNLKEPMLFDIDRLKEPSMTSLHDFDLGFNLMLMKEIGAIENANIIGIPADFHVSEMDRVIELLKRI